VFAKGEFVDAALSFPFSKTTPNITLNAGRCLVALLSSLGEEFHDDCRDRARDIRQSFARRHRLSCNVAMHPFHRIGSRDVTIQATPMGSASSTLPASGFISAP